MLASSGLEIVRKIAQLKLTTRTRNNSDGPKRFILIDLIAQKIIRGIQRVLSVGHCHRLWN